MITRDASIGAAFGNEEQAASAAVDIPTIPSSPQRRTRYVFFALGVLVYAIAVSFIGWRKVGGALAGADVRFVAAAAALIAVGTLVRIGKWRRALGTDRHAIGVYFLSRSGGVWSPARVGEFLPLMWKRHRNTRVAAWILLDRVLEILVTVVFGLAGLALIDLVPLPAWAGIAAASLALAAAGVYLLTRRDWLRALAGRSGERTRLHTALTALAGTSDEVRSFLRSSADLMGLTFLAKAADLFAVVLIFHGLHAHAGLALVAAAKCALAVASFIPVTPMVTGVPHTVQGWIMYQSAGVPPEAVVASIAIEAAIMLLVFSLSALVAHRAIRHAAL
jgi:hypothetical protein